MPTRNKQPTSTGRKPQRPDGRPGQAAYTPSPETRAQVEAYASIGLPQPDICRLVINPETGKPLSLKTLLKHFRAELDEGTLKANAKVGATLFRLAVGAPAVLDAEGKVVRPEVPPVVSAAIFWMKSRAGWSERNVHEVSGPAGEAIRHTIDVEFIRTAPKGPAS